MPNNSNDVIQVTVDKFIFTFPAGLRYSESGLWAKLADGLVRMGLSDFAQQRNGDIAFANLPEMGSIVNSGEEVASIETVKVNLSLPSPLKGRVAEINSLLAESPELINRDPYGDGWIVALQVEEAGQEVGRLLDAASYAQMVKLQAETDLKA